MKIRIRDVCNIIRIYYIILCMYYVCMYYVMYYIYDTYYIILLYYMEES